jgi:hypothetical protein
MPETPPNVTPDPNAPTTDPSTGSAGNAGFDGEFDAERAKRLIENLRADKEKQAARLAEFERAAQERADAEKSELQKAIERAERAEKQAAEFAKAQMKREALKAHGLSDDLADFIHGDTAEELGARAKALAEKLGAVGKSDDSPLAAKPKARLTAGHEGAGTPSVDPKAIARQILDTR